MTQITATDYQLKLKEKDQLIGQIQRENIALKGALREAVRLIRSQTSILQARDIKIPEEIADYLGNTSVQLTNSKEKGDREAPLSADRQANKKS